MKQSAVSVAKEGAVDKDTEPLRTCFVDWVHEWQPCAVHGTPVCRHCWRDARGGKHHLFVSEAEIQAAQICDGADSIVEAHDGA